MASFWGDSDKAGSFGFARADIRKVLPLVQWAKVPVTALRGPESAKLHGKRRSSSRVVCLSGSCRSLPRVVGERPCRSFMPWDASPSDPAGSWEASLLEEWTSCGSIEGSRQATYPEPAEQFESPCAPATTARGLGRL